MTSTTSEAGRLRLGLIGFGAAARMTLDSLNTLGNFDIVGAVEPERVVREAFESDWKAPGYQATEELFANQPMDAIYIAAPTRFHEAMVVDALQRGLHVLVEKPMALSIEACERMISAARDADRLLLENHKQSVARSVITSWKVMKSAGVGELKAVHRWNYTPWFYRPRDADERDPSVGGVVLRQGAHEFDIIRLLTQEAPIRLSGWTGDFDQTRPGEGAYQAVLEFPRGLRAFSFYSGYDRFDTAEFTSGLLPSEAIGKTWRSTLDIPTEVDEGDIKRQTIAVRGSLRAESQFGFTMINTEQADIRPAPAGGAFLYGKGGRVHYEMDGPSGTDFIAREFYDAIVNHTPALHDGHWGLAVLELCLAVRESARSDGAWVDLRHQYAVTDEAMTAVMGERTLNVK